MHTNISVSRCIMIGTAPQRFVLGASDYEGTLVRSNGLHTSDAPCVPITLHSPQPVCGEQGKIGFLHSACKLRC